MQKLPVGLSDFEQVKGYEEGKTMFDTTDELLRKISFDEQTVPHTALADLEESEPCRFIHPGACTRRIRRIRILF